VRGIFPEAATNALIPLKWLERAKFKDAVRGTGAPRKVGIDVAGPGEDETVGYAHEGGNITGFRAWPQPDPRGPVTAWLKDMHHVERVNVDSAGIGWYFYLHLKGELGKEAGVTAINVGSASSNPEKYANLKAELYWAMRMWFQEDHVAGLFDERTIAQLAGIRYEHDPRGRVVIEGKEDARKRGIPSPDRAEALMLALAEAGNPGWVDYAKRKLDQLKVEKANAVKS
jgi:hypothetical protein